jgi:hypothetical protein
VIERGHLEEGGNDVKACMTKQALGIFARETGGHFNSESLVPLEVGKYLFREMDTLSNFTNIRHASIKNSLAWISTLLSKQIISSFPYVVNKIPQQCYCTH